MGTLIQTTLVIVIENWIVSVCHLRKNLMMMVVQSNGRWYLSDG